MEHNSLHVSCRLTASQHTARHIPVAAHLGRLLLKTRLDKQSYCWYYFGMTVAKVAISLDQRLLQKLDSLVANRIFRSRSEAIQTAVKEKIIRLEHTRLAQECAKLDPIQEQKLADEGVVNELSEWPEY